MKIRYYLLSVLLLWSALGFGQAIKVTASVSSGQVGTGEQFEVTFSTNGNPESFDPPAFNGFQVVGGPNQSSSFSSVNGATTVNISVGYVLIGTREGEYTIGPASMTINGKQYRSNPVKIRVVKGRSVPQQQAAGGQSARPASGNSSDISKRLFLRAVANKTNVYQGEQISVSYKLYANINIVDNMPDKLPDFNGFWSQEIKRNNQNVEWTVEEYKGVRYHVAVLKEVILFPERFGKLTLDPLGMTFVVRQTTPSNDPIEQFFGGGSYEDVKYKIKSAPVTINVKPLPEAGKPAGFQGAVGNFSVGAALDKSAIKANEALNYTLKITGSGNLKLLKAPELNLAADIEKYDPKVTDQITESLNGVSGSREYSYLLIPRHEGNYTIDALKFSYFNPATQRYVTLSTGSFPVKVAKGAPGSGVVAYSAGQQDIKALGSDIRYIKGGDGSLQREGEGFYGSGWYYSLLCLGPLMFLGAFGYRKWYREQNKDQVIVKGRNANKVAAKHLANAKKQLLEGNKNAFYEDIYRGLYGYLSDKLNISAAHLNRENIGEKLRTKAVSEELILQLTGTLDLCEMARYAPVSGISEQEVFDKAKNIIGDIENYG
ncbi:MAG TPA: BatD family protein [Pedobacter sp.]|uniref:BatD family protein n=1 Tax=Pedobacter sp. TaxID=1411316 RepID=UPI002BD63EB9|nr:BatD family protein [Pedobacter sp.]HMI01248.1 BatD family protein [Pedobacter sp.]